MTTILIDADHYVSHETLDQFQMRVSGLVHKKFEIHTVGFGQFEVQIDGRPELTPDEVAEFVKDYATEDFGGKLIIQ